MNGDESGLLNLEKKIVTVLVSDKTTVDAKKLFFVN